MRVHHDVVPERAGSVPPVMFSIPVLSSLPNQTLPTRLPVKALNQALVELLVVPVLPEMTRPGISARAAGALGHDMGHHLVHLGDLVGRKDLNRRRAVGLVSVDDGAARIANFDRGVRDGVMAAVGERRVGADHVDHLHLVGADRQRDGVDQRRRQAEQARRLDDLGAPERGDLGQMIRLPGGQ